MWDEPNAGLRCLNRRSSDPMKFGIAIFRYLLESGADVNLQDQSGKTALMIALMSGHTEYVDEMKLSKRGQI